MKAVLSRPTFEFAILGSSCRTRVVEFRLEERLSAPYRADLVLACEEALNPGDVVGQEARLKLQGESGERVVHGILERFAQGGRRGRFILYEARLVPQLQLLAHRQDSRIFQNQGVREILTELVQDAHIPADRLAFRLQETYAARDYAVQYQETDLVFLSRLLETEGIWYTFEHSDDRHVLVVADGRSAYQPLPGDAALVFDRAGGMPVREEAVTRFSFSSAIVPGKVSQNDFNYNAPSVPLDSQEQAQRNAGLEVFQYPGGYTDPDVGRRLARIRLQEMTALKETGEGASRCPRLAPGLVFRLNAHPSSAFNRDYLVLGVTHRGSQPQALEESAPFGPLSYANEFSVIPAETPFRPARITPRPVIAGPQTAVVMGPGSEDIYTDDQGRVKVKFHWDRGEAKGERSSCWIRVSQFWAGDGWGAMFLPRRGQEVIVSFLDGDPDRPIITGRVYNAANPPPHALPDHKTKSSILTQSTQGGGGANELSFEDAKGREEIVLKAQKDLTINVNHDAREAIDHDQTLHVGHARAKRVGQDERSTIAGAKTESVGKTSTENVGLMKASNVGGACSLNVGAGYSVAVGGAMNQAVGLASTEEVGLTKQVRIGGSFHTVVHQDHQLEVSGASEVHTGKTLRLQAEESFEVVCGQASFRLDQDGTITLTGSKLTIDAAGPVQVTGETVDIN